MKFNRAFFEGAELAMAAAVVSMPAIELAWRRWHRRELLRHFRAGQTHAPADVERLTELDRLAHHDVLTGLPNRRRFEQVLASSRGERVSVMLLDFDRFKLVNDTHGHAVGDAFLCAVAARLCQAVREGDTVARLGGDEFAIVVRDADAPARATAIAERIRGVMEEPLVLGSVVWRSSASIGIASGLIGSEAEAASMVEAADRAMYLAKRQGGARFALASALAEAGRLQAA